ncbi:MAG: ATP-dependent RNA helicase HrpA [Planctomycetota bacterium]|jgi:ATP-dependent helicase HrpA|nr:ATP-dependent RNA helicase HrpA [Planctomycetota bacterium]
MAVEENRDAETVGDIPGLVLENIRFCMIKDRPRLVREAVRLREMAEKRLNAGDAPGELLRRFEASRELGERRRLAVPAIVYPEELPISARRDEIAGTIRDNQVTIIAGSTGSGKTTQLPKICLDLGRGVCGRIGVTQPRRLAAMSVSARTARELGVPLGGEIGFQVRFQAKTRPTTLVKFMTDGILLNEIQRDRDLLAYDTIILDEAHERNLDTDLLLGCIKRILPHRPEFRLIVSSATLDTARFSGYYNGAPAIEIEGRTYPVEVRYVPPAEDEDDDPDLSVMVLRAVEGLANELPEGDILVFLPGEADIREAMDTLAKSGPGGFGILPLFSRLTQEEQQRVFQPDVRKIILSTNVAETSLTIPGVRAVVDSGLARVRRALDRASVERLQIEKISQASAEQRKGRAGRVAPGICVRLYSEADFEKRPPYTDPEIRRASLASVILRLRHLGLGPMEDFPFLDPPQPARVREGYRELVELGALEDGGGITPSGRRMAVLPVEPRFARILLEAKRNGALDPALTIVAMLSVQDPRERPLAKQGEADALHRRFLHPKSDYLAWLELWKFYDDALATLPSKSQARKFCRQNFLNYLRMQEWRDIRRQTGEIMASLPDRFAKPGRDLGRDKDGGYARLHRSLLAGLLGRTGKRTDDGDYQGARGVKFLLWPGSGLARAARDRRAASREAGEKPGMVREKGKTPPWVMAAELVETSRMFGRGVAEIDPLWIEELAGPLARRSYSEPYYDERGGFVRAREKVEVYGLPVVVGRKVHYGSVNPAGAREVFIRQALVEGKLRAKPPFFRENEALKEAVADLAHKARQAVMVSDAAVHAFYDERLPAGVHNDKALADFALRAERENPGALRMTRDYLLEHPLHGITPDRFPPELDVLGRRYPLSYRFHPGAAEDGVTMTVPVADIPNLPEWRLDWLVPGLLGAKVAELLRGLPKSLRREFTPIPQSADAILPHLDKPDRPFRAALSEAAWKVSGIRIPETEWNFASLPAYLVINVRALDWSGGVVGRGRDLAGLAADLKLAARNAFDGMDKDKYEKTGHTAWDFGDLPERIEIRSGAGAAAFPALVDEGKTVGVRLYHTRREADLAMPAGFRRAVYLTLDRQLVKLRKDVKISAPAAAVARTLGGGGKLADDFVRAAVDEAMDALHPPRTHHGFLERVAAGEEKLYPVCMAVSRAVDEAYSAASAMLFGLERPPTPAHAESYRDILIQVESLLAPKVLEYASAEQIRQLPRYVLAAEKRMERLNYALAKDRRRLQEFLPLRKRYDLAAAEDPDAIRFRLLLEYRWLTEEWRIGLFAQEGGQKVRTSMKKIDGAWRRFLASGKE